MTPSVPSGPERVEMGAGLMGPPIGPQPLQAPPWQACPICMGRGHVMQGFYGSTQVETYGTTGGREPCKACFGRGIVR